MCIFILGGRVQGFEVESWKVDVKYREVVCFGEKAQQGACACFWGMLEDKNLKQEKPIQIFVSLCVLWGNT